MKYKQEPGFLVRWGPQLDQALSDVAALTGHSKADIARAALTQHLASFPRVAIFDPTLPPFPVGVDPEALPELPLTLRARADLAMIMSDRRIQGLDPVQAAYYCLHTLKGGFPLPRGGPSKETRAELAQYQHSVRVSLETLRSHAQLAYAHPRRNWLHLDKGLVRRLVDMTPLGMTVGWLIESILNAGLTPGKMPLHREPKSGEWEFLPNAAYDIPADWGVDLWAWEPLSRWGKAAFNAHRNAELDPANRWRAGPGRADFVKTDLRLLYQAAWMMVLSDDVDPEDADFVAAQERKATEIADIHSAKVMCYRITQMVIQHRGGTLPDPLPDVVADETNDTWRFIDNPEGKE